MCPAPFPDPRSVLRLPGCVQRWTSGWKPALDLVKFIRRGNGKPLLRTGRSSAPVSRPSCWGRWLPRLLVPAQPNWAWIARFIYLPDSIWASGKPRQFLAGAQGLRYTAIISLADSCLLTVTQIDAAWSNGGSSVRARAGVRHPQRQPSMFAWARLRQLAAAVSARGCSGEICRFITGVLPAGSGSPDRAALPPGGRAIKLRGGRKGRETGRVARRNRRAEALIGARYSMPTYRCRSSKFMEAPISALKLWSFTKVLQLWAQARGIRHSGLAVVRHWPRPLSPKKLASAAVRCGIECSGCERWHPDLGPGGAAPCTSRCCAVESCWRGCGGSGINWCRVFSGFALRPGPGRHCAGRRGQRAGAEPAETGCSIESSLVAYGAPDAVLPLNGMDQLERSAVIDLLARRHGWRLPQVRLASPLSPDREMICIRVMTSPLRHAQQTHERTLVIVVHLATAQMTATSNSRFKHYRTSYISALISGATGKQQTRQLIQGTQDGNHEVVAPRLRTHHRSSLPAW